MNCKEHDFPSSGIAGRMTFIRERGEVETTLCNNCLAMRIIQTPKDGTPVETIVEPFIPVENNWDGTIIVKCARCCYTYEVTPVNWDGTNGSYSSRLDFCECCDSGKSLTYFTPNGNELELNR